jgi:hypothetical protein
VKHVTAWGWYWLALLALIAVPEVYWAIVRPANTISDTVWGLERLDLAHPLYMADWSALHWGISIVLWLLFAWLSFHLPFGFLR